MKGTSPTISPRKNVSTFLNELPEEEEALYIIASCRGVKSVPSNQVRSTVTIPAQRTAAQIKKLESAKREAERKSKSATHHHPVRPKRIQRSVRSNRVEKESEHRARVLERNRKQRNHR